MTEKFLLASLLISSIAAQTPPPVPPAYQDLYTQLTGHIGAFDATVKAAWNGQPFPVQNSAQLRSAACEQGSQLLAPNYYGGVLAEMQSLQALGIKTMTVHIDFPTLYAPYYRNRADYQNMLNFYIQLSNEIRARGLRLIVENSIVFPQPGLTAMDASAFYRTLSWPQYEQARAQQAATIAQQIHPDYLTVISEPDTEANATLQTSVNTASGSTDMVNQIMAAIQIAHVTDVKVGAGSGTWQANFQDFANGYASTAVQYLDMHIYPANRSFLNNAITIAQIAQAAGKQVGVSEAWLYKERDSELGVLTSDVLFSRDVFSFWQPLDQMFLQSLVNFAQYKQLAFISPFWSSYFHTYLDYDTHATLTPSQLLTQAGEAAATAINTAQFTSTAASYENMFVKPVDTIPPSAPQGLAFTASTSQINVTWGAAADNVGVAGYNIYRNGTLAGTTGGLFYQDFNMPANTTFTYAVSAFDALKNTSTRTLLTAATRANPDTQPPSMPTGLTIKPVTSSQVNLTWSPSTDNVGVMAYKIYRGASPASLPIYASSTTNVYSDLNCSPTATYYYALQSIDAAGNVSAISPAVSGRSLPDTIAPSIPATLSASSVTSTNVTLSWKPSTDNVGVAGYQIYRGDTAGTLRLIAGVPTISYADARVTSRKSYYYAVAAQDTSKNASAQTAPLLVTTP